MRLRSQDGTIEDYLRPCRNSFTFSATEYLHSQPMCIRPNHPRLPSVRTHSHDPILRQQQLGKMLRLSLFRSTLVKLPAPALRRQGWAHALVTPKVIPISGALNCGAMRSFTATNARMSTIEERVKKIVCEQLGVKQEEVCRILYHESAMELRVRMVQ